MPDTPSPGPIRTVLQSSHARAVFEASSSIFTHVYGYYDQAKNSLPDVVKGRIEAVEARVADVSDLANKNAEKLVDSVDGRIAKAQEAVDATVQKTRGLVKDNVEKVQTLVHDQVVKGQTLMTDNATKVRSIVTANVTKGHALVQTNVDAAKEMVRAGRRSFTARLSDATETGLKALEAAVDYVLPNDSESDEEEEDDEKTPSGDSEYESEEKRCTSTRPLPRVICLGKSITRRLRKKAFEGLQNLQLRTKSIIHVDLIAYAKTMGNHAQERAETMRTKVEELASPVVREVQERLETAQKTVVRPTVRAIQRRIVEARELVAPAVEAARLRLEATGRRIVVPIRSYAETVVATFISVGKSDGVTEFVDHVRNAAGEVWERGLAQPTKSLFSFLSKEWEKTSEDGESKGVVKRLERLSIALLPRVQLMWRMYFVCPATDLVKRTTVIVKHASSSRSNPEIENVEVEEKSPLRSDLSDVEEDDDQDDDEDVEEQDDDE